MSRRGISATNLNFDATSLQGKPSNVGFLGIPRIGMTPVYAIAVLAIVVAGYFKGGAILNMFH